MFETDALYQNDPKWKNVKLGNQNNETIGSWGCLVTCLTMVANGFGFDETPQTINTKLKVAGGFQGAMVIPAALPNICPGLVYKGYQPCEDSPAPIAQIDTAINKGNPVIAQVDWSPKSGLQTHWIVLYGKTGNDYYMKDPYRYSGDSPDKEMMVLDRYTHAGKDIAQTITGVIWIEGSTPPQPKPKIEIPADSLTLYAAVDGLAFRSEPSVSAALIRRLPINARLETLESKKDAEMKIGINGKWIHIQDSSGDQGYSAAWYISKSIVDQEGDPSTGGAEDVEYYLIPIADGLAVRAAPNSNAQLIKRVPLNTRFGYFESRADVNKKIGVFNQWIHVYDDSGLKGYAAAWYLARKAGTLPAPPKGTISPTSPPSKTQPQKPANPIEGFAVIPTTDGLAFRSSTSLSAATLIKRLDLNTILAVVEPEDQARRKVGTHGEWLKVKDTSGRVGYVAAWYVKAAPQTDSADDEGSSPGVTLRTTTEGVALRRLNKVTDHTLIKRLPNNSAVFVLEQNAESKIGESGEWLKVRDSYGTEGFIAAWYVAR